MKDFLISLLAFFILIILVLGGLIAVAIAIPLCILLIPFAYLYSLFIKDDDFDDYY